MGNWKKQLILFACVLTVALGLHFLTGGHAASLPLAAAVVALSTANPTLLDVAKRTDQSGRITPVVEAMQQRNGFLQSMVWKTGNLDTGHQVAARNALPSVAWVRYNEGVSPSKSTVDTYQETTGILEGLSSIDERVAQLNGNQAAFRASEDDAFLAAMANTLESAFFYESTKTNPERILGLAPRLGLTTAAYGSQILKGGGAASDNTSIWLLGWGDRTLYGISPRGTGTGLEMKDMGLQRTLDSNNKVIYKYETRFRWRAGLCVEDYRYVVRICNIPMSTLSKDFSTGADLINLMIRAFYMIYDPKSVRLAWYCNRTMASFLHQQAQKGTAASTLTINPTATLGAPGIAGQSIVSCLGAPIYITDALTNAETTVS